jgi:hypothetical protein
MFIAQQSNRSVRAPLSDMSPLWGSNSKGGSIYKHSVPTGLSIIEFEERVIENPNFKIQ